MYIHFTLSLASESLLMHTELRSDLNHPQAQVNSISDKPILLFEKARFALRAHHHTGLVFVCDVNLRKNKKTDKTTY